MGTSPIQGLMDIVEQSLQKCFTTKVPIFLLQWSTRIGCPTLNHKEVMVVDFMWLGVVV